MGHLILPTLKIVIRKDLSALIIPLGNVDETSILIKHLAIKKSNLITYRLNNENPPIITRDTQTIVFQN